MLDQCKLLRGDFQDLDSLSSFEDNISKSSFNLPVDTVISVQALHEVPSATRRKAFSWAKKALSKGGLLIVLDRFKFGGESLRNQYKVCLGNLGKLLTTR